MKKTIRMFALALVIALSISLFASCGGATDIDLDGVDYSSVSLTIKESDFDKMEEFLKELESGKYDRNVVKITGENATRQSNCTILVKDGKGTGRGVSWEVIDGKYPDDYPADGAKITITGVLVKNDSGARVLMVPADKVEK